ncbi:hypothetical protein ACFXTH_008816 [Malus domestica]
MSEKRPDPETTFLKQPYFKTPVPAKARSKQTRTDGRVWSLGSPSLTKSSSLGSSSSSSSLSNPWFVMFSVLPRRMLRLAMSV